MTAPTPLDRELLARVLGMLGSLHDGEILNAAKQAERLRQAAGLSWPDVVSPALPRQRREHEVEDNHDVIVFCRERAGALTAWEIQFLVSIARRPNCLSGKQLAVLRRLAAKCRGTERSAA